jgi:hypothetical protein
MRVQQLRLWPAFALAAAAFSQTQPDLQQVIERLNRLESQNQELINEIRELRQQLSVTAAVTRPDTANTVPSITPAADLGERVDLNARRIEEQDQLKIGAEHRVPVTLTGTVLFNAFLNGRGAGGADNPLVASSTSQASAGATFRQTIIGLKFDGPDLIGGGKLTGSVNMDFFGGGTGLNQSFRLRVANVDATWKNTTLTFAFDKPLVALREPDSLSQVGVSALTAAGNLWLWQPQVRAEQRFAIGDQAGLRAQVGLYQTAETGTGLATDYGDTLARSRPGYEGRFELWAQRGPRRIEIAPGFHISSTRVLGTSVPSRIFSLDWLIRPTSKLDLVGTFFQGENVGVVGGLRQGVTVIHGQPPASVNATGGWAQLTYRLTPRLTFHGFGGQEDDRNRDLTTSAIGKNQSYGGNLWYRLGTNVITGIEAAQVRTNYVGAAGTRINQHYDLAIGYLF